MKLVSGKNAQKKTVSIDNKEKILHVFQWRPIETAPQDGTEILVTGLNYGALNRGRHFMNAKFDKKSGEFINMSADDSEKLTALTHWTHLVLPEDEDDDL